MSNKSEHSSGRLGDNERESKLVGSIETITVRLAGLDYERSRRSRVCGFPNISTRNTSSQWTDEVFLAYMRTPIVRRCAIILIDTAFRKQKTNKRPKDAREERGPLTLLFVERHGKTKHRDNNDDDDDDKTHANIRPERSPEPTTSRAFRPGAVPAPTPRPFYNYNYYYS